MIHNPDSLNILTINKFLACSIVKSLNSSATRLHSSLPLKNQLRLTFASYITSQATEKMKLVGNFSAEGIKAFKSSIPKLKQWNKKSPVASALYRQQCTKLQQCMKVNNAASPPHLEFLTHRSYCLSKMSRGELLRFSSSFRVKKVKHTSKKTPKSAKQEVIVFFQAKYGHKERRKRPFDHVKRELSKPTFILLCCYFSTTVAPTFLERKGL